MLPVVASAWQVAQASVEIRHSRELRDRCLDRRDVGDAAAHGEGQRLGEDTAVVLRAEHEEPVLTIHEDDRQKAYDQSEGDEHADRQRHGQLSREEGLLRVVARDRGLPFVALAIIVSHMLRRDVSLRCGTLRDAPRDEISARRSFCTFDLVDPKITPKSRTEGEISITLFYSQ